MSRLKRGDTMIEVMFAVAIFGMLSVLTIGVMSNALGRAEGNLEQTMAREEMEAQAEAIRFIYTAAQDEDSMGEGETYKKVWKTMIDKSHDYTTDAFQGATDCSFSSSDGGANMSGDISTDSFALNLSALNDEKNSIIKRTNNSANKIKEADTYPIVESGQSWGLWINVKKQTENNLTHYDFYIHTCYYAVGSATATKLDSTVRLMDPGI